MDLPFERGVTPQLVAIDETRPSPRPGAPVPPARKSRTAIRHSAGSAETCRTLAVRACRTALSTSSRTTRRASSMTLAGTAHAMPADPTAAIARGTDT